MADQVIEVGTAPMPALDTPGEGDAVADVDGGEVETSATPVKDCRHPCGWVKK